VYLELTEQRVPLELLALKVRLGQLELLEQMARLVLLVFKEILEPRAQRARLV
jgi:hypothetical protein